MTRGNQRDKAREKNLKEQAGQVGAPDPDRLSLRFLRPNRSSQAMTLLFRQPHGSPPVVTRSLDAD